MLNGTICSVTPHTRFLLDFFSASGKNQIGLSLPGGGRPGRTPGSARSGPQGLALSSLHPKGSHHRPSSPSSLRRSIDCQPFATLASPCQPVEPLPALRFEPLHALWSPVEPLKPTHVGRNQFVESGLQSLESRLYPYATRLCYYFAPQSDSIYWTRRII